MTYSDKLEFDAALDWCTSMFGPAVVLSDHSKTHGGHASSTSRIQTKAGFCYLKIHQNPTSWHNEVHAYEHWAGIFGDKAPKLLAVREILPLALVISELPGEIVEKARLSSSQEAEIWRSAGAALAALHAIQPGEFFGPCQRDGTRATPFPQDPVEHISQRFNGEIERAMQGGYLHGDELSILQAARELIPSFEGEPPCACHRDYCAANWLVNHEGNWAGVIDFEFAYWDMRLADFSRDPDWNWMRRPDLADAFFEGYRRSLSRAEERQLLVLRAEYALSAILWGHDFAFYGFEQEGHAALTHLASELK